MEDQTRVIEYKCPCCGAGLRFGEASQKLKCEYCDNSFDLETVQAYNASEAQTDQEEFQWDSPTTGEWVDAEDSGISAFLCPSCGGEIVADGNTAATFCPYCSNPTILPSRLSGMLKPEGILPFQTSKEDAKAAFLKLCKGKPLLPKFFTQSYQVEKITGLYVPFWLCDCSGDYQGSYKATRLHHWSDSEYDYTRTDHYMLQRSAKAHFSGIPFDGSSKMDDTVMESIEPFDYGQLQPFDAAYLTGFLADKYDVTAENGQARIRERVDASFASQISVSTIGYSSVIPTSRQLKMEHGKAKYVLLPVWILNTRYNDKIYPFVMNGQTGKMTGTFPICPKRTALWFSAITAGVTLVAWLIQMLL